MANYKVVFRAESRDEAAPTRWEAGCPLLVQAIQVSRNTDTGQSYLQAKLWNLTAQTVGRFTLQAEVRYTDGTSELVEISPLDADIAPQCDYRPDPVPLTGRDVAGVEARILAATYGDTCWHSAGVAEPLPCGAPLVLSEDALAERQRILDDLGKAPSKYARGLVEGDGWWICPCGAPNAGRDTCCFCDLPKATLEQLEDENYLRESIAKAKRNRKRLIAILAAVVLLVIGGCLLSFLVIQPEMERLAVEQRTWTETLKKQAFLDERRSCFALTAMTRTVGDQLESTTSFTLDERGNIIAASRTYEKAGTTRIVNVAVDDLGFPTVITDENGAVLSEFSVEASNDVGLPSRVTQTASNGVVASYIFQYDKEYNLSYFGQTIDGECCFSKRDDGEWRSVYSSADAQSNANFIASDGWLRDFATPTFSDEVMDEESGRFLMYDAAGSRFDYSYEQVASASPWAAIVAQTPVEQAPLPYNIWLGIE